MFRQGDVLIVPLDALPVDARPRSQGSDGVVLATGEATGHAHAIRDGAVRKYDWLAAQEAPSQHLLEVLEPCTVTHEEHDPIPLSPGLYRVIRQREYRDGVVEDVVD